MSNYNTLKTTINANIKQNGNQEITGQILNSVLNQMVTTLGAGYQFAGVATTATNPGTPDAKVFYIANGKGTYTNFSGLEVAEDEVVVLYYDTEWHKVATGIASQAKLSELGNKTDNIQTEIEISETKKYSLELTRAVTGTTIQQRFSAKVIPGQKYKVFIKCPSSVVLFQIYGCNDLVTLSGLTEIYRAENEDFSDGKTIDLFIGNYQYIIPRTNLAGIIMEFNVYQDIIGLQSRWKDLYCVCYGDSITAQGNSGDTGYANYLKKHIGFAKLLCRGVGGQSFKWNTLGFYVKKNGDGGYVDRYLYDAQGQKTQTVVNMETITPTEKGYIESALGYQIDLHYGCFSSWDRITGMIPNNIRESIDCIILMGGTNDQNAIASIPTTLPRWSASNTTDTAWINATGFYNGGDFDVNTFDGGFASTIMKFQLWCPNAVLIVATPWGRWDTTTKYLYVNNNNISLIDISKIERDIAAYLAAPVIDVNGQSCLNAFNYSKYVADGLHPNEDGQKLIARVICGELERIYPRIEQRIIK